jgi:hypothetical protein
MRMAWAEGKLTSFDELRTTTRLQGVAPILLSLYQRGFLGAVAVTGSPLSNMVPASVMPLDTMHVFEEGWTKAPHHCVCPPLRSHLWQGHGEMAH